MTAPSDTPNNAETPAPEPPGDEAGADQEAPAPDGEGEGERDRERDGEGTEESLELDHADRSGNKDDSQPEPLQAWRAALYAAPLMLLAAVAAWEIWAAARAGHDVPGDAAWQRAAQVVRERFEPGDLIVFAPDWIDPVGRMHLGDLISIEQAGRMDDARHGRVWELSIQGATAAESRDRQVAWSQTIEGIRVRELVREPAVVVTDFVDRFEHATVQGRSVGRPRVALAEVGFEPHRCVQAEPWPDETVRVVYKNVRLGSSLVAYVGLADVFTRRDVRDPGRLQVRVNGQQIAERTFGVDDGWVRVAAETEPAQAAEVVFAATAMGPRAKKRLICFAAEARQ